MKEIRRLVNSIVESEFQCRDTNDKTQMYMRSTLLFHYWDRIDSDIRVPLNNQIIREIEQNERNF